MEPFAQPRVRRRSTLAACVLCALLGLPLLSFAAEAEMAAIQRTVAAQHDASVKRLQDWIALPSIAAENLNSREGAEASRRLGQGPFKRRLIC